MDAILIVLGREAPKEWQHKIHKKQADLILGGKSNQERGQPWGVESQGEKARLQGQAHTWQKLGLGLPWAG